MANDKYFNYDHSTGKIVERLLSDDEQAVRDAEVAALALEEAKQKEIEENTRQLKISAYQKLGLSAEEIEALLPNPATILINNA